MPGRKKKAAAGAMAEAEPAENESGNESAAVPQSFQKVKKENEGKENEAASFTNCDMELWEPDESPAPAELPATLHCLDVFAGCGGLHMDGTASYGGKDITLKTICAVEIEKFPAM